MKYVVTLSLLFIVILYLASKIFAKYKTKNCFRQFFFISKSELSVKFLLPPKAYYDFEVLLLS